MLYLGYGNLLYHFRLYSLMPTGSDWNYLEKGAYTEYFTFFNVTNLVDENIL